MDTERMIAVTVELPEEVAGRFGDRNRELSRRVLEAVAFQGYCDGTLSRGQVSKLLGLDWHQTEEFLRQHGAPAQYTLREVEADRLALADLTLR